MTHRDRRRSSGVVCFSIIHYLAGLSLAVGVAAIVACSGDTAVTASSSGAGGEVTTSSSNSTATGGSTASAGGIGGTGGSTASAGGTGGSTASAGGMGGSTASAGGMGGSTASAGGMGGTGGSTASAGGMGGGSSGCPVDCSALPALWLRADQGVIAAAGKVSDWQDQSGNGHHATMSNIPRQPTLVVGALNGQPVIHFDGTQSLYLVSPVQPMSFSVFVVGKNGKANEDYSIILGPGGNWPNNQLRWEDSSRVLLVGTGNALPITTSTIGNTKTYHLLTARYDHLTLDIYRDGNFVSSHSFTTTGPWILDQVGAWYSTYFMEGELAEILVYDEALSDADRTSVDFYLRNKYALP